MVFEALGGLEHADVGASEPFKKRARSPFFGLRLVSLGTRMSRTSGQTNLLRETCADN